MPRVSSSAGGVRMVVPGLYGALREREREHYERHAAFAQHHPQYRGMWDGRVLDGLEAGVPVVVQGRRLKGWGVPRVPLRRDQAFQWFTVCPDDSVTPAESPKTPRPPRSAMS